ncbi:hypothetical protein EKK58_05790 [Candidatus Dependentiae bacterium]|nr:MAG: hypothetical protein EKK58_05790 [Candidatus Dependentiae bacterium]
MATWWNAEFGRYQGRIAISDAPDGSYVYQLGHALPGIIAGVNEGDYHKIEQTADFSGVKLLRATIRTRPIPNAFLYIIYWQIMLGIDGVHDMVLPFDSEPRVYRDIVIPTFDLPPGTATLYFKLILAGVPRPGGYEFELAGAEIDAVEEDTSDYNPGIANRIPEPGADKIHPFRWITFDLFDTGPDGVDLNRTTVKVAGEVIYENGSFVGSWAGSSTVDDVGYGKRFSCAPGPSYGSDNEVLVEVESAVIGGLNATLVTSWTFHTIDFTRPHVASAFQLSPRSVRVTFSEEMRRLDDGDASDALNVANYTIELISDPPAVIPQVIGVIPDDDVASVILLLSDDVTHKTTYRVVVANVHDTSMNVIDDPKSATFSTITRTDVLGRDWWLIRKLPAGLVETDTKLGGILRKFIACLQILFDELLADIDGWPEIFDPDLAPEQFVDAMLEDLGNPFPFVLDENTKRQLALLLVPLYQQKGTDQGMIDAIRLFLGIDVTIVSPGLDDIWTLDESELDVDTNLGTADLRTIYSFDVISPIALTEEQRQQIRAIVAYMRRAPTHLRFIIEPDPPPLVPDHWELGLSELETESTLHE